MSRRSVKDPLCDALVGMPWWTAVLAPLLLAGALQALRAPRFLVVEVSLMAVAICMAASWAGWKRRKRQRGTRTLQDLHAMTWRQFEALVADLYRGFGWAVSEAWGEGPDGGVDLDLRRGHEHVVVQCKQWRTRAVPVTKVRELLGIVAGEQASGGIFVCCGSFTREARDFARGKPLQLVDGQTLLRMLAVADFRGGRMDAIAVEEEVVRPLAGDVQARSVVAAVPSAVSNTAPVAVIHCPLCNAEMVRRTARKGRNAGADFWGCSKYPRCNGSRNLTAEVTS